MATQIITFDNYDLSEWVSTWQEIAPTRLNAVSVPRRHGLLISDAVVQDARRVNMSGRIVQDTAYDMRELLAELSELLNRKNKRLQLWDDRFLIAYKSSFGYQYVPGSAMRAVDFTIEFLCVDPFWYSTTDSSGGSLVVPNLTTGDIPIDITNNIYKASLTLVNNGNLYIFPIITISPTGGTPLTHITLRNLTIGRLFTYEATVAVGTSLVVDTALFTVMNNGVDDLTNWAGDFLWLDPGVNNLEIEGTTPAAYGFSWTERFH